MINDLRIGERWSFRWCPGRHVGCAALPLRSEPTCGFVLDGPPRLTIQGAARMPLTFPVLDVVNRLPAGGAAITGRVAGRDHRVFVAAWPIA
jgi:hypothetical protein